eukprot:PITA_19728
MSTPMITNWKKLYASDSELVDPTLYRQLIGSLMYLVNTRPDICFAVNTMSQFMCESRKVHWVVAKHILRYLQGTVDYGLDYRQGDGVRLVFPCPPSSSAAKRVIQSSNRQAVIIALNPCRHSSRHLHCKHVKKRSNKISILKETRIRKYRVHARVILSRLRLILHENYAAISAPVFFDPFHAAPCAIAPPFDLHTPANASVNWAINRTTERLTLHAQVKVFDLMPCV